MLHRVFGKLVDGTPFSARIEAPNTITAFVTARKALNDGGKTDEEIQDIRARPIVGKSAVTFGKIKTAEEIAKAKADRAAKEAAKGKPVATPPKVPAPASNKR